MANLMAIYVMWLREMKRYIRAKSRIVGSLIIPLLFLVFLGLGLNDIISGGIGGVEYINFLVPGIIGMAMIFTSMFAGISVLWDRQFGFLKEIMVAPVSRIAIVLGRILGSSTTSIIQGILVLILAILMGFVSIGVFSFLISVVFMFFIAITFIGFGLMLASKMRDMQGFGLIMNLIIFPLFFLSGALFPLENMPDIIRVISYIDPLTYGVDGLRGAMLGISSLPIMTNLAVLIGFSALTVILSSYLFGKSDVV